MKKLVSTLLLTVLTLTTLTGLTYADDSLSATEVTEAVEGLKASTIITKPQDIIYITSSDNVIITGTGKESDIITMIVYTKNGSIYNLIDEKTIEVGQLGVFTTKLSLKYATSTPKSVKIAEETYVQFRLTRENETIEDVRLIKYKSEEDLQVSLQNLRMAQLIS